MKYLVEKGANIELANQHGHTPLMIASFRMHFEIVSYLLAQGANPLKSSERGLVGFSFEYSIFRRIL